MKIMSDSSSGLLGRRVHAARTLRLIRSVTVSALVALSAVSCGDDFIGPGGTFVVSVPFEFLEDATGRTGFRLTGVNGRIDVVGRSQGEGFTVRGFRRVQNCSQSLAEARIDDVQVDVSTTANEILVQTIQPLNSSPCTLVVDYELSVPERMLALIFNVNGEVSIRDLDQGLSVTSVNGRVVLDDVEDDVSVRLTNGSIEADVRLNGDHAIDLQTVNGRVDLTIPATSDATLSIALVNGAIRLFNLTVANPLITPTSLSGIIGTGQGSIVLRTTNGDIVLTGV